MKKIYVYAPGPTSVPQSVLSAESQEIIHHRTPQFTAIFREVQERLKKVFCTKNDVLIFTASGTGAMEAAVTNLLSKNDVALTVDGGKFGERWGDICDAYGVKRETIKVEWGHAVTPAQIESALKANPSIKAVYVTLTETSTGVLTDVEAIAKVVKGMGKLIIVDAISGAMGHRLLPDEWSLDVVVSGSQKGLMVPPGLAFFVASEAAYKAAESSDLPKFYFDILGERKALKDGTTAFTPAISLIRGLYEALGLILGMGMENLWKRHERHAKAVRAAVKALGLELYSKDPCNVLTPFVVPAGIEAKKLHKCLRDDLGVTMAAGQGKVENSILRIGHMGYYNDFDALTAISAVEKALRQLGYKGFEPGVGVAAAQKSLMEN